MGNPKRWTWLTVNCRAPPCPPRIWASMNRRSAWATLQAADQTALAGHPGVSVRHAGGQALALLVVDPVTRTVERAEGDAFHLARLTRDVVRAAGPLIEPQAG